MFCKEHFIDGLGINKQNGNQAVRRFDFMTNVRGY